MKSKAISLLVLDLDGTVRQGREDDLGRYVNGPQDVVIFPEALDLMRRWKTNGGRIIGVTNQPCIGLEITPENDIFCAIGETHKQLDGLFDAISVCPHHPEAIHASMRVCWCRKPAPGLVFQAALSLSVGLGEDYPVGLALFVGDRETDKECARRINMPFMWAKDWRATAKAN